MSDIRLVLLVPLFVFSLIHSVPQQFHQLLPLIPSILLILLLLRIATNEDLDHVKESQSCGPTAEESK
jgi:hypothetical protein